MARAVNYLSNKNLLTQIHISLKNGKPTNEYINMWILLINQYASKSNFNGYTYLEDMKQEALLNLYRTWDRFDPNRSDNPFAYITQCVYTSFLQYIKKEKKHQILRDTIMSYNGLNGSTSFQLDNQSHVLSDDLVITNDNDLFTENTNSYTSKYKHEITDDNISEYKHEI